MENLTDLEIFQKIAEIHIGCVYIFDNSVYWDSSKGDEFNPLTDKALCFDLMVEYEIDLLPLRVGVGVYHKSHWELFNGVDDFEEFSLCDKNPQRAICLAIIKKSESKWKTLNQFYL